MFYLKQIKEKKYQPCKKTGRGTIIQFQYIIIAVLISLCFKLSLFNCSAPRFKNYSFVVVM